jgi:NOL1/NOP2/sun family putative RNA methylase
MTQIPEVFFERMVRLLGGEFPAFRESFKQNPISGLRVNTLKISVQAFLERTPFRLEPVPAIDPGFLVQAGDQPGKHPYHAAGLYYLQEPSAMAVSALAAAQPGECVLDLCAAPGGKATHLAAAMQGEGWLLANEIHHERVWELVGNLERWGATNASIVNETPQRISHHFGAVFDRVLVDAPCSGEGMFRRSEAARREWSQSFVVSCALRQSGILQDAARLVKPGGMLIYSTCTFAPEENEGVISDFLDNHPEFRIEPPSVLPGASMSQANWAGRREDLRHAIRFWPHHYAWEGHFVASLRKNEGALPSSGNLWQGPRQFSGPEKLPFDILDGILQPGWLRRWEQQGFRILSRLNSRKDSDLFLFSPPLADAGQLRLPRPGLFLGTLLKGRAKTAKSLRFEPAHALALAVEKQDAVQSIDSSADSSEIRAYLIGETLAQSGEDGWVLICVDGFPLGWGKRHRNVVKNHYPRGLRWL